MNSPSQSIHSSAIVSSEARISDDVRIGPHAIIEGDVEIGPRCIIGPKAYLVGPLKLGCDNHVFPNAVIGEIPQDTKYDNSPTGVIIGDHNVFRENTTINRATTPGNNTVIGNHNFFMVGTHVGHDSVVGNHCTFANCACLGGHTIVQDQVFMSAHTALHQFCRVGRLAMLAGLSATTMDLPPFTLLREQSFAAGINLIGMRRAGMTVEQINAVRRIYHIFFRQGNIVSNALVLAEAELGDVDSAREFIEFVRASKRGILHGPDRANARAA